MALLVTMELAAGTTAADVYEQLGAWDATAAVDGPLARFAARLAGHGLLERTELALPGDAARAAQFVGVREAVPAAVNRRVGLAQQTHPAIRKTAADVIVPFAQVGALLDACAGEFERRGLDGAVWGHISDGNLHPNVMARLVADIEEGEAAVLAIGRTAVRLGGAPLAEHGVGRNRIKQLLLAELYGVEGIASMRQVKQALDPAWRLARGVLFRR